LTFLYYFGKKWSYKRDFNSILVGLIKAFNYAIQTVPRNLLEVPVGLVTRLRATKRFSMASKHIG
jgi:hypothetical protein